MALSDLEKVLSSSRFEPQREVAQPQVKEEEQPVKKGDLSELERKLSQQNQTQQGEVLMQKLMSDPDISKILKARQEGKTYKVLGEDELSQIDPVRKEAEIKDEDLSDPKKLSQYLVQQTAPMIKELIKQELTPLKESETRRQQKELVETQTTIERRIKEVKAQNPDFDDHLPQMRLINQQTGGTLDPAELYILAKNKAGELGRSTRETESERPTTDVTRSTLSPNVPRGSRGLESIISSGFDRASGRSKL